MYDYNEEIKSYESDCVNLPKEIKDKLREHRDANRDRLKANRPDSIRLCDSHFVPQGSMAINTTIQHPENDYDIDDGAWFYADDLVDESDEEMTAREVQEMVRDALQDDRFNKKPKICGNCVRVYYAEGHHVDVPCYKLCNAGEANETQYLAGENGWIKSDPTQINRWFTKRVEDLNSLREGAGSQLRKMVRLMKRFARSRKDWDMPNGLKLTMLTEECLPTSYERQDQCFYYLLVNLKARLALSLEVENRAQEYPRDKLTKSNQDSNMVELRTHVGEAIEKLGVLFSNNCTSSQAKDAWEWVFQSDGYFDAYSKDSEKAHSLFEKRALLNAGLAKTSSSGIIYAASSSISRGFSNSPHEFYGDHVPLHK